MRLLVLLQAEQRVRAIEAGWADRNIFDAVAMGRALKPRCCAVPYFSTVLPVHRCKDKHICGDQRWLRHMHIFKQSSRRLKRCDTSARHGKLELGRQKRGVVSKCRGWFAARQPAELLAEARSSLVASARVCARSLLRRGCDSPDPARRPRTCSALSRRATGRERSRSQQAVALVISSVQRI
jgi:hypothetical protein